MGGGASTLTDHLRAYIAHQFSAVAGDDARKTTLVRTTARTTGGRARLTLPGSHARRRRRSSCARLCRPVTCPSSSTAPPRSSPSTATTMGSSLST